MFPVKVASPSEYKLELHTSPIGKPHVFIDTNAERPKRRPVNSKGGVHMWNCQKDFTQRMDAGVANHLKAFNDFLQLGTSCHSKKPPRIDVSFVRNQQNCFKETVSVPAKQKKRGQNAWSLQSMQWVVLRFGVNLPVHPRLLPIGSICLTEILTQRSHVLLHAKGHEH